MPNCQVPVIGSAPDGRTASARRLAACCALAAALALPALSSAAPAPAAPVQDDTFWITIGADVFARARAKLAPLPGWSNGVVLERLDEHDGVVLTRIPAGAIDALSHLVHEEFHSCGGFVKHESLAEAEDAMARLRSPQPQFLALPFSIDQPALVGNLATQVSEANLLATITSLSTGFPNRYHAHHAVHQSANWIRDQWIALAAGRPDVTVEMFSHGGITPQPSVILTIPGSSLPNEYVILGGHQDSTRSNGSCSSNSSCIAPGADDDASGIAVLTEAIRVALANGFQPQRTVQFMAYAAEEVGLLGSNDIAADYDAANVNVVAVLQQDMTAYHGSAQDIYLYTNQTDPELNAFFADLIEAYQPGVGWANSACSYACSDHASWTSHGYRASFAFEAAFGQHNQQIHTGSDTVATIGNSAAHAAKFARLAVAFMVEAAVDSTEAGTLRFSSADYSATENGGIASLTVSRADGSFGAATVHCRTVAGGTATAGADYSATDATLSWAAGQGGDRTCSVPILNDTFDEPDETVLVELQDASGAPVGTPGAATLTILDNDIGGFLQFASATSQHTESAGTVTLTVTRVGGGASGVTVDYAVTGGTATGGGIDFTLAAGTLTFGTAETGRTFEVTLTDDLLPEPDETIQIQLSSATGGATLGTIQQHTLTILASDADLGIFADGFESGDTSEWSTTGG
ncbi:MAG: M20/M25/M40 family metallo-hydrolase [Thermoanaerobaculia bacterium]|nr:MAG: M20/M25/M40 family metallo-hydrolase [Thermoanaerobaculia bacterium]MBZ0100888.1 M20/M25/M40 family metallo-hydrolase [Thermoanaerobaculia bacterium]